jgi:hypothetical protein
MRLIPLTRRRAVTFPVSQARIPTSSASLVRRDCLTIARLPAPEGSEEVNGVILHTLTISIISATLQAFPFAIFLGDSFRERDRGVGNLSFRRLGAVRSLPVFLVAGFLVGSVVDFSLAVGYPTPDGVDPVGRMILAGACGVFAVAGTWAYLLKYDDGTPEPRWFRGS